MSDEFSAAEKIIEEVLIDLMTERVMSMSKGIQATSTRGVQASPSTSRRSRSSQPTIEKRTKHRDNLANVKLISSIFLDYILPLASAVSHDSVPRDFEYTMVTAYLLKRIHTVRAQQDKNIALNFR
jgi:hypothetical protein